MTERKTEQAKSLLVRYIRDQQMKRGDRLPPQDFLRKTFKFGTATISAAINELKDDGVLEVRDKVGVFVIDPNADGHAGRTIGITMRHAENSLYYSCILTALQMRLVEEGCMIRLFRYQKETYTIHLAGSHQLENAVLALAGIRALQDTGYQISGEQIRSGMEKARWNGRFTILKKDPYLVVDGAHNPDAARKLQESLRMYFPDREFVFLMGVFRDKQYEAIAERMAPMAREIIAMETPDNPRALPAKELGEVLCRYKTPKQVYVAGSLEEALQLGMKLAGKEDVIVAFGSLSFIGDLTKLSENLE